MSQDDHIEAPLSTPVGTRRKFFHRVTALAMAAIGAGLGLPLIGYVISPAFKRREQSWVDVGELEQLSANMPKQLEYVTTLRDGWMETTAHKAVWALKNGQDGVKVYSPLCPHLGCGFRWDDADRKFKCPCHGSVYDVDGRVLAGPAPRPLDILPSKVENGRLLVLYKEFKAGLPSKVEI
jgi:menaquinol-cytochrome c reductase iron-sulfur subunit